MTFPEAEVAHAHTAHILSMRIVRAYSHMQLLPFRKVIVEYKQHGPANGAVLLTVLPVDVRECLVAFLEVADFLHVKNQELAE